MKPTKKPPLVRVPVNYIPYKAARDNPPSVVRPGADDHHNHKSKGYLT